MKYHYKSPEEIRADRQARADVNRSGKNRSTRVILLDVALLFALFALLAYAGVLFPGQQYSKAAVRRGAFEISGSLNIAFMTPREAVFYLHVKNLHPVSETFPPTLDPPLADARLELRGETGGVYSSVLPLPARTLAPGETALIRGELELPEGVRIAKDKRGAIELGWAGDLIRLEF